MLRSFPNRQRSLYKKVSRRAFVRSAMLTASAVVVPGVFANTAGAAKKKAAKKPAAKPTPTTVSAKATPATTAAAVAAKPVTGAVFDQSKELAIAFTFEVQGGGGRINNPYVVVWVEDASGKLLRTVGLWFQRGRGLRYLDQLSRWFEVDSARINSGGVDTAESTSSPTRLPGAYSLAWDGTDDQGIPVPHGKYILFIEAARERGPYEIIQQQITIGPEGLKQALAANGELTKASIELRSRA